MDNKTLDLTDDYTKFSDYTLEISSHLCTRGHLKERVCNVWAKMNRLSWKDLELP